MVAPVVDKGMYEALVAQVQIGGLHPAVTGQGVQLGRDLSAGIEVAHGERDICAGTCQHPRGVDADPGGGAQLPGCLTFPGTLKHGSSAHVRSYDKVLPLSCR